MSFEDWQKENAVITAPEPTGFEAWKAENVQAPWPTRVAGAIVTGKMRLAGAVLDLPKHIVGQVKMIPMALEANKVLAAKTPQERARSLENMARIETFYDKVTSELGKAAKLHRNFTRTMIKNHPEWESEPPKSFIDLVTSPDKLAVALAESTPLLLGAGILTAAGAPQVGVMMMYASEGQEAYDRAIATGASESDAESAYLVYGSVAAALENMQLQGIMKISKGLYNQVLNRTAQKVARRGAKSLIMDVIKVSAKEALEEATQGTWGDVTAKMVYGEPFSPVGEFIDRRAQEAYIGFMMGVLPAGASATTAKAQQRLRAKFEAGEAIAAPPVAEPPVEGVAAPPEAIIPEEIKPITPDQTIGKQYGLTPTETEERLGKAELRYRELKTKPVLERTNIENKELAFLSRKRKDIEAILDRETQPLEPKRMTRKTALALGHDIPKRLGWTEERRRSFMKDIVDKTSMKDMLPAQREQIVMALQREAKAAGIEVDVPDTTPAGELAAKMQERKQKPALTRRDRRNIKKLRKALYTLKSGTSYYFLHSSRLKRICRSLDNYEDNGPFMRYVYQPVKDADTAANVNFSRVMAETVVTMNDLNIDAPAMMTEVKDIGIADKLSTAERIGVWALAQNKYTMNHLRSEFSEGEIAKIIKSVEISENEMLVAAEVQNYFEEGWPLFQAVARANGIEEMTKAENYMTAFVVDKNDLGQANFLEGLMEQFTEGKYVPGQQHTTKRKHGAKRNLELNIFVIHARAARALERFKMMAPVASSVGSILSNRGFKQASNDVTYGHGSRMLDRWLQDSIRGHAAYDSSALARSLRWLRMAGVHYVLGFKILTAAKQGISFFPAAAIHPGMIPLLMANLERATVELKYGQMEKEAMSKSGLLQTRDWNRDLRQVYNQKSIRKMYKGQKLSPLSMRMASYIDRHTTTIVWTSAYQLAQRQDMNEDESIRFADGVVEDTQPMGKAVDLPSYFRGNELEKNLTVFQNQVNQNGNFFWYNILGETKARKISLQMAGYRLLMSQVLPAILLGMISRGRPPKDVRQITEDILFYIVCPFVFVGRFAYNAYMGDWGPTRMIAETPFMETRRLIGAIKRGDPRQIVKYGARTVGAWSGGKIPLQAITTAEGAWDLATEQDDDFRRLVWSKYALKRKKEPLREKFAR